MEGAEVAALARQHKKLTWQRIGIVAGLTLIAAVAFIISNFVGAIDISPAEVMKGIVNPAGLDDQTRTVLWQLRLPMAVMAVLIGMALSMAGAEMQTILNNPLAEPFTLGISAAAAFGGATSIVLGLGGTASIDGGMGILAALGAAAHDARGYALPKGGAPLVQLDHIDTAQLNIKAGMLDFTLLADTRATPVQAATMYGPQKGAQGEQVALLAGAMLQACEVTGTDADSAYYGAAGGLPIGLSWLSRTLWGSDEHVRVLSGGTHVAAALGLPEKIASADLVITGEGRFDEQSLTGKAVGTITDLARQAGTPVGIIAGSFEHDTDAYCAPLSQEDTLAQQLAAAAGDIVKQL